MKAHIILFLVLISTTVHAQIFSGATAEATGRSGRAAVDAGVASFTNAANLVHMPGRDFYSFYSPGQLALAFSGNDKEDLFPASIAYFRNEITNDSKIEDFRLAVGEFVGTKFAVGVVPHYYMAEKLGQKASQFDGDIGLTFTPLEDFGFALVGYNLLDDNKDISPELRPQAQGAAGFNYVYKNFLRVRADVSSRKGNNWTDPSIGSGLETYTNKWVVFRIGYLSDRDNKQELTSFGLGFDLPRFKTNYAYVALANGLRDPRHYVDLVIPF